MVVEKDITSEVKIVRLGRNPLYFPGVEIRKLPLRDYPARAQAADVVGPHGRAYGGVAGVYDGALEVRGIRACRRAKLIRLRRLAGMAASRPLLTEVK